MYPGPLSPFVSVTLKLLLRALKSYLEDLGTRGLQESLLVLSHQQDQWDQLPGVQEGRCLHDYQGSQLLRGDLALPSALLNPEEIRDRKDCQTDNPASSTVN